MKPIVTWVLLADGAQAKVFEHGGPGKGLTPVRDLLFEEEPLQAREIMADKPGRSFSSVGRGRSAIEYSSDPVQVREARFVKSVAEVLQKKHHEGAFQRLVIAAAPTALGDIRTALGHELKEAVIAELPKDFLKMPTPQLERQFEGILAM